MHRVQTFVRAPSNRHANTSLDKRRMDVQVSANPVECASLMDEDVVKYVASRLDASELRLYLHSMVSCIQSSDKFPVSFDTAVQWLGKKKSDLKRTLLEKLKANEDFTISNNPSGPEGGRPTEIILLTVRGFKTLCARSRGKRAESIQDYYVKLESLVVDYTVEKWKNARASMDSWEETVRVLNAKIADLTRAIEDASSLEDTEGMVYIVTSDVLDAVKIGHTKGSYEKLRRRYLTCYGQNMTIRSRRVADAARMEKVLHVRFEDHRKSGELFDKRYLEHYVEFMEKLT